MKRRALILLPAYNESAALRILIPAIGKELQSRFDWEIVVVDDGSSDDTAAVCEGLKRDWPIQILRHSKNQGYGAAIKTGILWIIEKAREPSIIVTLDADNTHLPVYIPSLMEKLDEGFDVITASTRIAGGQTQGVPWNRRLMSDVINQLFQWRVPQNHTRSFTNGFRAYRVTALQKAHRQYGKDLIQTPGFPGGVELFSKVLSTGARDGEVPFTLHYENRGAQSKIQIVPTIMAYLRLLKNVTRVRPPPSAAGG